MESWHSLSPPNRMWRLVTLVVQGWVDTDVTPPARSSKESNMAATSLLSPC
jgi:hypothetical protein